MTATILLTGFGPFSGAPFNPTGPLVTELARRRIPGLHVRRCRARGAPLTD
jgi:pyrrolidone-carboxylate peptidase